MDTSIRLNPYSNGIYSMSDQRRGELRRSVPGLNPYSYGIYSMSFRQSYSSKSSRLNPYSNGIYSMSNLMVVTKM